MDIIHEFDLDLSPEYAARRADAMRTGILPAGLALAGAGVTLLNLDNSQTWREQVAPLARQLDLPIRGWRARAPAGGALVQATQSGTEAAAGELQRLVIAGGAAGITHLCVPIAEIGDRSAPVRYIDALNTTYTLLRPLIPELERSAVTLCLPAGHGGFLMSPPELRDLLDQIGSPYVAAAVDGGSLRCDRADPRDWLMTLGPRVGLVDAAILEIDNAAPDPCQRQLTRAIAVSRG